jgi:hypothetical protein
MPIRPPVEQGPAVLARTSGELLGRRPLPSVLTSRPVTFILGPPESGRTTVGIRLLGEATTRIPADQLRKALTYAARHRRLPGELREARALLLDDVDFLHGRLGAIRLLGTLVGERTAAGLRTAICQGRADTSVTALYSVVDCPLRASVILRFPVGRGRRRYVNARCRARGIDPIRAQGAITMEPWSYLRVDAFLDGLT